MSEEFVNRIEFNMLKDEVESIKSEMADNSKLLHTIDKKIDVISSKIENSDKMDDLKLQPIDKRVKKLEDGQDWLWKTLIGGAIGILIKILLIDLPRII